MTMKKKILTTLSVVLILGMAALGILAYLSDTDSDVNVMTLGNVDIEQIEDFEDTGLYPNTTVKKIVTVDNVGKSNAYVRTWFAFEAPVDEIIAEWEGTAPTPLGTDKIDGKDYVIYAIEYGEMTPEQDPITTLKSVSMDKDATNDSIKSFGDTYEVLVFTQAIQTAGFANEEAAWAAEGSFGATALANHPWKNTALVDTAEELADALAAGKDVTLMDDIDMEVDETGFTVDKGVTAKLDLNGHDIIATSTSNEGVQLFSVNGNLDIVGQGTISLTNDDFAWTTSYRYTAINIREAGVVTLGDGVKVVCKTGSATDKGYGMTYAVDIYTTGTLNVNGASLHSNYIAVRCFFGNSIVNVNSGSITSEYNNYGIWPQSSPGAVITIAEGIDYTTNASGIYIFTNL